MKSGCEGKSKQTRKEKLFDESGVLRDLPGDATFKRISSALFDKTALNARLIKILQRICAHIFVRKNGANFYLHNILSVSFSAIEMACSEGGARVWKHK